MMLKTPSSHIMWLELQGRLPTCFLKHPSRPFVGYQRLPHSQPHAHGHSLRCTQSCLCLPSTVCTQCYGLWYRAYHFHRIAQHNISMSQCTHNNPPTPDQTRSVALIMQQSSCTNTGYQFPPIKINVQIPHELKGRVEVHFQSEELCAPRQGHAQPAYAAEVADQDDAWEKEPFPKIDPYIATLPRSGGGRFDAVKTPLEPVPAVRTGERSVTRRSTASATTESTQPLITATYSVSNPVSTKAATNPPRIQESTPVELQDSTRLQRASDPHVSDHQAQQFPVHEQAPLVTRPYQELRENNPVIPVAAQHYADTPRALGEAGAGTNEVESGGREYQSKRGASSVSMEAYPCKRFRVDSDCYHEYE